MLGEMFIISWYYEFIVDWFLFCCVIYILILLIKCEIYVNLIYYIVCVFILYKEIFVLILCFLFVFF